ncbi:MAG: glycerol-3-phosphate responsive antiterminator [Halanaerobiales bacterium]|nr:glycerol-3-phosphate responsive antiterminator [Halanaerobiales bacterium]
MAGGLINERSEVEELLEKGVFAVSSSNKELWEW